LDPLGDGCGRGDRAATVAPPAARDGRGGDPAGRRSASTRFAHLVHLLLHVISCSGGANARVVVGHRCWGAAGRYS
jgi:hypothetical protein